MKELIGTTIKVRVIKINTEPSLKAKLFSTVLGYGGGRQEIKNKYGSTSVVYESSQFVGVALTTTMPSNLPVGTEVEAKVVEFQSYTRPSGEIVQTAKFLLV